MTKLPSRPNTRACRREACWLGTTTSFSLSRPMRTLAECSTVKDRVGVAQLQHPLRRLHQHLLRQVDLGDVGVAAPEHFARRDLGGAAAHLGGRQGAAALAQPRRERVDGLLRGQDLARIGDVDQARAEVHGVAEHVAALGHHRPVGEADLDREIAAQVAEVSAAVASCMSQAARNAASGVANWHTMPSPSVLTTLPFAALTFLASTANRRLMTPSARVSPSVS
jgi:hypothetical protein